MPDTIHYVEPNGDLSVVNKRFDAVFSSHMIEHAADLAAHLKQIRQHSD